jgi:hypothetical protein
MSAQPGSLKQTLSFVIAKSSGWQLSKVYTHPLFARGFQNFFLVWFHDRIMQAASRRHKIVRIRIFTALDETKSNSETLDLNVAAVNCVKMAVVCLMQDNHDRMSSALRSLVWQCLVHIVVSVCTILNSTSCSSCSQNVCMYLNTNSKKTFRCRGEPQDGCNQDRQVARLMQWVGLIFWGVKMQCSGVLHTVVCLISTKASARISASISR